MRKGQISLEYVAAMLFVIFVLAFILFNASDQVPDIRQNNDRASVNLEARTLTSTLLDNSGKHSFGSGGENWEKNVSTRTNAEEIGFASRYHVVERDKIMALNTVGSDVLNYSQFRELTDVDNQYRFVFTALPVVDTSDKFFRTRPPEEPSIVEPDNDDYNSAGNQVGYGDIVMGGTQYNILTTAHDGQYDTLYIRNDSKKGWNFTGATRFQEGENINIGGREFNIEGFHNTRDTAGNVVILSRELKDFGSQFDVDSTVIKLSRYAAIKQQGAELQPLRLEVYSWN